MCSDQKRTLAGTPNTTTGTPPVGTSIVDTVVTVTAFVAPLAPVASAKNNDSESPSGRARLPLLPSSGTLSLLVPQAVLHIKTPSKDICIVESASLSLIPTEEKSTLRVHGPGQQQASLGLFLTGGSRG